MKTRIVAALVASLAVLTAASAEAGPRRRVPGSSRRATTSAAPSKEHPTKPASDSPSPTVHAKKQGSTKPASDSPSPTAHAKKQGPTKPVSDSPSPAKHAKKQGATRPASYFPSPVTHGKNQGPTKPASLPTIVDAPAPDKAPSRAADKAPSKVNDKAPSRAADKAPSKVNDDASHKASKVSKTPALSRFIAAGIPLAEVRDGRLVNVGTSKKPCGTKNHWAKKGGSWTALDAWGQVTGTLTVAGSDRYEGTGCHRLSFAEGNGKDGLGVFVAKGSGYSPAPSARWNPASDVVKRFEHLYTTQTTAWVDGKPESTGPHGKTLFFNLPKQEGSVEGAPTLRRPTHWAVTGGRVLVVAYVGATGAWKVGHVLAPNGKDHAYEPLAVLDMNGDGLPEIVVHEEAGGVFTDRVLSFDAGTMRWEKAVESPGGATP